MVGVEVSPSDVRVTVDRERSAVDVGRVTSGVKMGVHEEVRTITNIRINKLDRIYNLSMAPNGFELSSSPSSPLAHQH
jgi:hypothetical protein